MINFCANHTFILVITQIQNTMRKLHSVILFCDISGLSFGAPGVGIWGLGLGKVLIPTWHPDTLFLVSFVPCFQFTGPGAVGDLVAAATRSQLHRHRATAVIAEVKQWFPKRRIHTQRVWNRQICVSLFSLSTLGLKFNLNMTGNRNGKGCVCIPVFFCSVGLVWGTY